MKFLILSLFFGAILFITVIVLYRLQSKMYKKQKATIDYLKDKANNLSTKEEMEAFHKEFLEKGSKIDIPDLKVQLISIDSYLRGLYKNINSN
jgi:hypothetical protein